MPGPPVTLFAVVSLTPGAAGPPDAGVLAKIPPPHVKANGMPLATVGSTCVMINSASGVPYMVNIPALGASIGCTVNGKALVRLGDRFVVGSGILVIAGLPPMPTLTDMFPP